MPKAGRLTDGVYRLVEDSTKLPCRSADPLSPFSLDTGRGRIAAPTESRQEPTPGTTRTDMRHDIHHDT